MPVTGITFIKAAPGQPLPQGPATLHRPATPVIGRIGAINFGYRSSLDSSRFRGGVRPAAAVQGVEGAALLARGKLWDRRAGLGPQLQGPWVLWGPDCHLPHWRYAGCRGHP